MTYSPLFNIIKILTNSIILIKNYNYCISNYFFGFFSFKKKHKTTFLGQHDLKLKCGEDATLGCHGPKNATIRIIRWSRDNIQPGTYVFYYKQNRDHEELQDPSFKGRVMLKDLRMKDGDVSVILRNVTMNDTGTYKCYVGNTNINKTVSINLTVEEPGE